MEGSPSFLLEKQLTVVLENHPGTLADVCSCLAVKEINILALSIAEMIDTGELRIVVNNARRAKALLEEWGFDVLESEVLVVGMTNEPGVMAQIARRLAKGRVNIEYAYCSASKEGNRVLGVLKVSDASKALDLLADYEKWGEL
ncbi:MAG TPA: ACT domain-containing protein [Candidatus Tripitaka californicus]|uniref:ACT domain-containing protein n=1 Tax=Candidatus Tripitaka californicus TaxID=3367616 RepID=UPI004029B1EB|nr:amino acid-binding protein [Planctomycetota bacterium]